MIILNLLDKSRYGFPRINLIDDSRDYRLNLHESSRNIKSARSSHIKIWIPSNKSYWRLKGLPTESSRIFKELSVVCSPYPSHDLVVSEVSLIVMRWLAILHKVSHTPNKSFTSETQLYLSEGHRLVIVTERQTGKPVENRNLSTPMCLWSYVRNYERRRFHLCNCEKDHMHASIDLTCTKHEREKETNAVITILYRSSATLYTVSF
jgi:hypothetical protein